MCVTVYTFFFVSDRIHTMHATLYNAEVNSSGGLNSSKEDQNTGGT